MKSINIDCCKHQPNDTKCIRKGDDKIFKLPRRFTRKRCITGPVRGFTMKSSCSPYKGCSQMGGRKRKKTFKNFKEAHYYNKFRGSYRYGTTVDNNGHVVRSYSHKPYDYDKKGVRYYYLKSQKVKDAYKKSMKDGKKVRLFTKNITNNTVEDVGNKTIIGFTKSHVKLF